MVCTPLLQRFSSFSAACGLGGVCGAFLGVLLESRQLPGSSAGRPLGCLGIHGHTLGILGCSRGFLGRLLGGSWGVLGKSLSGPSAPYVRTLMCRGLPCVVALAKLFWIVCCSRGAQADSAQLSEPGMGQGSPDAMHSDVLAHPGASSLGAMYVHGSPWCPLEVPWGSLGGSFWIPCGGPMRHTLRAVTFQRLVCFHIISGLLFLSFPGDSLGDALEGLESHTLCTPMFRACSKA